ncbi:uncharacterized protein LOC121467347 isoform X3 [Drosophila elegans]|uniref:uncharacterized protein LOC121467347 isoform X3 n=1 Tax=Drosophila elegans TaxID=30023 RepID=UPI001BC857E3|nr:uncharacterized protein LOC121467347 isoform X3 [Drosophila elegans]
MDCSSVTCSAGVNFDCLEFITVEEIKDAIPPIGIRVLFREKLFAWRKTKPSSPKPSPQKAPPALLSPLPSNAPKFKYTLNKV